MPFPPKLIFLVLSFVCFLVAAFMDWPRNPPVSGLGHTFGWAGGMFLALAVATS